MTVEEHVRAVFLERLNQAPCLVIYDPEKRYRDVALGLGGGAIHVVDAGCPVLQARAEAMEHWLSLTQDQQAKLVVYVPRAKPNDTAGNLADPFLVFRVAGAVFPEGASHEYQALCAQAFPEQAVQVEALFRDGIPDFAAVNALQAGPSWPRLRSILKQESAVEILFALMAPTSDQRETLEKDLSWMAEATRLAAAAVGCILPFENPSFVGFSKLLWKQVLFSEFATDLPADLPPSLQDMPHASEKHAAVIRRLCELLRTNVYSQDIYVENAKRVEREIGLVEAAGASKTLGTWRPFHSRTRLPFGSCAMRSSKNASTMPKP